MSNPCPGSVRSATGSIVIASRAGSYGVGYVKVHVAVDDATRLAYVEVLTDVDKPTVICFLSRAIAWSNGQRIECRRVMSDNGPTRLRLQGVRQGLQRSVAPAHPYQALHARNQRQDGAIHSDPLRGVGPRHGLPGLRGAEQLAAAVPGDRYPPQEALGPRLSLTSAATHRAARLNNVVRHIT